MPKPHLTFFCELDAAALQSLFAEPSVMDDLVTLEAGVSLGILDLSPQRAEVVRRLNEAGIPVIAWLLLPEEDGYWFNLGNVPEAAARYGDFRAWTAERGLQWAGIGLDIEPDIREVEQLLCDRWRLLPALLGRLADRSRLRRAQAAYRALAGRARVDGYLVESYQIPFLADERRAGSTLLQRLGGLVDIPVDREVLMLYTSFLRPYGAGVLWSYVREAQAVGVGSTGGGVAIGGANEVPPLSWDEFARDLRLAARHSRDVYIFSLEGCASQGFLGRLNGFDWDGPSSLPAGVAARVERARRVLRAVLWADAHPWVVLGTAIAAACVLARLLGRRRS